MNRPETEKNSTAFGRSYLYILLISLGSLTATFIVSNTAIAYSAKLAIFASIVFLYILLCAGIYLLQKNQSVVTTNAGNSASPFDAETEAKLFALEEANQFFGASLKSADMFRLIASRVNEIIPYSACALFFAEEAKQLLKIEYAAGEDFRKLVGTELNWNEGLAGKTFHSRKPQVEEQIDVNENANDKKTPSYIHTAIAVPLLSGEKVFGVFVLYGGLENFFIRNSLPLLEAVGARIAPLFLSSRAFESNLANALTDALTRLPNERGFFLVLENQIAESQRFRDERPLTILAIDIKNFGEYNGRFGHATGDRLLIFAADKIKNQLRQMDFLAHSAGDEFLAVLPTASEEITREIIERIERIFVTNPFVITEDEKIHLQLSFGTASFGKDGETAAELLKYAITQKQQSKLEKKDNKILWFPKEYIN